MFFLCASLCSRPSSHSFPWLHLVCPLIWLSSLCQSVPPLLLPVYLSSSFLPDDFVLSPFLITSVNCVCFLPPYSFLTPLHFTAVRYLTPPPACLLSFTFSKPNLACLPLLWLSYFDFLSSSPSSSSLSVVYLHRWRYGCQDGLMDDERPWVRGSSRFDGRSCHSG